MATINPERLAELRAMPYEEYLTTPEWLATRKRILKRDQYQCQGCQAQKILLHVHHYTYARLGCEDDEDLVTLCEVCHDELHRQMADPAKVSFLQMCGVGLSTAAIGTIGIEGFLHAPLPAEIGVLVGAFLLAKKSPLVYARLKGMLPAEVMAWLGQGPERKAGPSWLDAWLGREPKTEDLPSDEEVDAYIATMADRQEDDDEDEESQDDDAFSWDGNDEEIVFSFEKPKGVRVFSDLLKTGWRPSMEQIYVGTDKSGNHLFVPVGKLWHVALAGATGYGKSSLLRLVMVQLCSLKLPIVLLNPHYMIYDFDHQEDWTPYTPYLKRDPMACKKMDYIATMLRWMAGDLLEMRKERTSRGESAGKPFFFILDEFPDIKAEIKDAPTLVGKLLRQGRKYGIYLILASQDYSVKTLGVEGEGSLRKCFRTIFYVGGDPVSVKELLNKAVKDIPENDLGQGTIMLKCATIQDPIVVHVPYLDNESLYLLLGPSTYVPPKHEGHADEVEQMTTAREGDEDVATGMNEKRIEVLDKPTVKPNMTDTRLKSEDIHIDTLIQAWNVGINTVSKMENFFRMSHGEAYKAYKRVKAQRGEPIEEQE